MSSKMTHAVAFMLGAVAGAAAVWQFAKKKYGRIADEEIRSVKEAYSRREAVAIRPASLADEQAITDQRRESVVKYAERLKKEGYLPGEDGEKEQPSLPDSIPHIIAPEEFGDLGDYEQISLTLYGDGTLADENDEVIENIDEVVGSDFLTHFGEYEDDSIFVRNDKLKCDYEILLDQRPYSEVLKIKPYLRGEG